MRNFCSGGLIRDKKFVLAFIITLICAIICGIVLYKPVISNQYLRNFADDYVYNVFNFKNSTLLLTHLISDLIYLYIIFFIGYFTRLKYFTLIFVFLRGLFFGVYSVILFAVIPVGGVIVGIFVFVPSTVFSILFCFLVAEGCKNIYKKYALCMPLVLAVVDLAIFAILINLVFRIVIIIV